ncbi:MAG: AMP-binding protein [Spirochaetales bacterium]|nr:AMP-binding protein [Spirochaetales bacterium]
MSLQTLWRNSVRCFGDFPFLDQWKGGASSSCWTYAQTDQRVQRLVGHFLDLGLQAQDRVALWSGNQPGWGALALAVQTSGLIFVPFLPDFPVADVVRCLRHAQVRLLVVGTSFKTLWTVWLETRQDDAELEEDRLWAQRVQLEILEEVLERSPSPTTAGAGYPNPLEDQPASILYTSGTTGVPKGVVLTHANLVANVRSGAEIAQIHPGDRLLSLLPLAHAYEGTLGFLIPMACGGQITYLCKPPSPTVLLPALAGVRPHLMLTVPLFIEKVVRQKVFPVLKKLKYLLLVPGLSSLIYWRIGARLKQIFGGRVRFFGIGGAQLAPEVEELLRRVKFPYAIGYGLPETSPLVAGTSALKGLKFSTGPVLDGVEVRIAGQHAGDGVGEIQVRGANVFTGYWNDEERTAEAFTPDGWFKTGDLGLLEMGNLFIKGRSKNMILGPNGENVYPESIEALLNVAPLVVESLVVSRNRKLVAKVVLNAETLPEAVNHWVAHKGHEFAQWKKDLGDAVSAYVQHYLDELLVEVNRKLARAARLSALEWQTAPFEKTATMKIKRFLYDK